MAMACKFMSVLIAALLAVSLHSMLCYANDEADALLDVKKQLTDPQGVLSSWVSSLEFEVQCTWFHVTCDGNNKVTRVDLNSAGLSGTLSPSIGHLSSLQYLHLSGNSLSGVIPESLGDVGSLKDIDLSNNKFTGPVPPGLEKFGARSFAGNPGLCGNVVNKACGP